MGFPKALIRLEGRTFLERILGAAAEAGLVDPVIVAGRHYREILAQNPTGRVVFNPDYESGMTTSFQTGIRALPADTGSAMVFLVDHPNFAVSTLRALLEAEGAGEVVVPVHRGRRGHPVLFSIVFMNRILRLDPVLGVNTLVRADEALVREVLVNDPGILDDIDSPQDLARLRRSLEKGAGSQSE